MNFQVVASSMEPLGIASCVIADSAQLKMAQLRTAPVCRSAYGFLARMSADCSAISVAELPTEVAPFSGRYRLQ